MKAVTTGRNTKSYKKLLQTIIYQQTGQVKREG